MNKLVNIIVRLLNAILKIFKGNKPALMLPHPEEKPDYTLTVDSINVENLMNEWLATYDVPAQYHDYWRNDCKIILSEQYPYPAATSAQTKTVYVRPEWCNPGVIAHEVCHVVWYYLPPEYHARFEKDFDTARAADELLQLAWETKPYMRGIIIETHADCYRYLGRRMPEVLKKYYPKLI